MAYQISPPGLISSNRFPGHGISVLSNHYHAVITDVVGIIPEFMAHLNKLVSKCVNVSIGRWENVFSMEQPSLVRCEQDQDVLDKMVYTLANPVSLFLVSHGHKWPGVRTDPTDLLAGEIDVPRPAVFFQTNGPMPEVAKLKLTRPSIFSELSDAEFVALLQRRVDEREEIRRYAKENGIRFLEVRGIQRQRHTDTPTSHEPRRNLKPRVAARNKWRRIEALQRLKEFVARSTPVRDLVEGSGATPVRDRAINPGEGSAGQIFRIIFALLVQGSHT